MGKINKKILKGSARAFFAEDEDIIFDLNFKSNRRILPDLNITRTISIFDRFQKERNESNLYRLSGQINPNMIINNKQKVWSSISDLFAELFFDIDNPITFPNYFDIGVYYISEYRQISTPDFYNAVMSKLVDFSDVDIFPQPIATNYDNDANFLFVVNQPIDISNLNTIFQINNQTLALPVTELYLYIRLKQDVINIDSDFNYLVLNNINRAYSNPSNLNENTTFGYNVDTNIIPIVDVIRTTDIPVQEFRDRFTDDISFIFELLDIEVTTNNAIINQSFFRKFLQVERDGFLKTNYLYANEEIITGDLFDIDINNFTFKRIERLTHITEKTIPATLTNPRLLPKFFYNPFVPIQIDQYSNLLDSTFPDQDNIKVIPPYAYTTSSGAIVWRNILNKGDVTNQKILDPPFINGSHNINLTLNFSFRPYLEDIDTRRIYEDFTVSQRLIDFRYNNSNLLQTNVIKNRCL